MTRSKRLGHSKSDLLTEPIIRWKALQLFDNCWHLIDSQSANNKNKAQSDSIKTIIRELF